MWNYFSTHPWYSQWIDIQSLENYKKKYSKELSNYINIIKNWSILEIWSWQWKFAYFCDKIWVKDYTWIDIDDYFFNDCKCFSPNFNFIKTEFSSYLNGNINKFDVIFTSHLLEHLDNCERENLILWINKWLKKWGIWINYMPNADSVIMVWFGRYNDITHKTIYNPNSFEQLINLCPVEFTVEHINPYIWLSNFIFRIIHLLALFFTKIYYLSMWSIFPKCYLWEFISVLKKNGEKNK